MNWDYVLKQPAFVINLKERISRRETALCRCREVGYEDVRIVEAVEPGTVPIFDRLHPRMEPSIIHSASELGNNLQKAACRLSHLNTLMLGLISGKEHFTVFEDDIKFHQNFADVAPLFWSLTPKDFDMVYLGGKMWWANPPHGLVVTVPMLCTHAMLFSREGATRAYEAICRAPKDAITVDVSLSKFQERAMSDHEKFNWFAWNGSEMSDYWTNTLDEESKSRCYGIVYQDNSFESDIFKWK